MPTSSNARAITRSCTRRPDRTPATSDPTCTSAGARPRASDATPPPGRPSGWSRWSIVLPDSVDDPDDPLAWLAFNGRWGERQTGSFNGPTGPATKVALARTCAVVRRPTRLECRDPCRRYAGQLGDRRLLRRGGVGVDGADRLQDGADPGAAHTGDRDRARLVPGAPHVVGRGRTDPDPAPAAGRADRPLGARGVSSATRSCSSASGSCTSRPRSLPGCSARCSSGSRSSRTLRLAVRCRQWHQPRRRAADRQPRQPGRLRRRQFDGGRLHGAPAARAGRRQGRGEEHVGPEGRRVRRLPAGVRDRGRPHGHRDPRSDRHLPARPVPVRRPRW